MLFFSGAQALFVHLPTNTKKKHLGDLPGLRRYQQMLQRLHLPLTKDPGTDRRPCNVGFCSSPPSALKFITLGVGPGVFYQTDELERVGKV